MMLPRSQGKDRPVNLPTPTPRLLTVYAADGTVLASVQSKSNAPRISARGAADQRQLDSLVAQHPAAVTAKINDATFKVVSGRTSYVGV